MKRLGIVVGLVGLVVVFVGTVFPTPGRTDAAVRINNFGCVLLDGNGGFVVTTDSSVVITDSGNGNLKCQANVTPSVSGRAVHYDFASTGLLCGTINGVTSQWHETVSASGKATLQCKNHP